MAALMDARQKIGLSGSFVTYHGIQSHGNYRNGGRQRYISDWAIHKRVFVFLKTFLDTHMKQNLYLFVKVKYANLYLSIYILLLTIQNNFLIWNFVHPFFSACALQSAFGLIACASIVETILFFILGIKKCCGKKKSDWFHISVVGHFMGSELFLVYFFFVFMYIILINDKNTASNYKLFF